MDKIKRIKWDEYRVSLFKKKIRAALPRMVKVRFERSIGRCNLILNVKRDYYSDAAEVFSYALARLRACGIEAEAKAMSNVFPGPDYITIPIDQDALPERKRRATGGTP